MNSRRMPSGFSLLETMIALGLIGVLIATIGFFVNQVAGSREQMRTNTAREALATAILDGLQTAFMSAIARTGTGSPGMIGTARTITVSHDGVVVSRVFGATPQNVLNPETALIFEFDPGSGGARLRRDGPSSSSAEMNFGAVKLRYLSDGIWSQSWNSFDRGGLPSAIECSIWWVSPFEEERSSASSESDDSLFEIQSVDEDEFVDDQPSVRPPDRMRLMRVPDGGVSDSDDNVDAEDDDSDSTSDGDSFEGGDR